MISVEKGLLLTLAVCLSAGRISIFLYVIFSKQIMNREIVDDVPIGSEFVCKLVVGCS